MSLKFGRPNVAIPGPSILPDRVLAAMQRPSPNIYEGELVDIANSLYPDLKSVARTAGEVAVYIANGHGAWEAAIANTLSPGDRIIALNCGFFGRRWGATASRMGIEAETIDAGMTRSTDPDLLRRRLRDDRRNEIKAVLATQTDTASSARNDICALRQAINDEGHDALLMVDSIASLGCEPLEMDAWGIDVMVAGSQKGLMTPPGLAFVFFGERARLARDSVRQVSYYWDWVPRTEPEYFYNLFGGTAPTHHVFALREALDMLVHEEGIKAAWMRHDRLAQAVWAAVERWSVDGPLRLNIPDPNMRSRAVTTIRTNGRDSITNDAGDRIRAWCEKQAGVTLGIGLGFPPESAGSAFRIGHMGHLNIPMIMGTLGSIDAALKALAIPHGRGALDAAAEVVSSDDRDCAAE